MQSFSVEQQFSFGTPRADISLTGRYTDLGDQADDRLRAAVLASLVQVPQLIESQQAEDSSGSSSRSGQQAQRDYGTAASRHDSATDSNTATVRIENGSGSIEVKLTLQPTQDAQQSRNRQDQQPQLSATFIQGLANTAAATVMNHADAIIQHTPPKNDAFVQMMRYQEASRSLDPSQHSQGGVFAGSSGGRH